VLYGNNAPAVNIDMIINNPAKSRKEQLLHTFEEAAVKSSSNTRFKFWGHENHSILLESTEMYNERLNWNPVKVGFVAEP